MFISSNCRGDGLMLIKVWGFRDGKGCGIVTLVAIVHEVVGKLEY